MQEFIRYLTHLHGKVYIGESTDLYIRALSHKKYLTNGEHNNKDLLKDVQTWRFRGFRIRGVERVAILGLV
nr:MAG TPA: GIY-YIG nuclease superfamily protein [Bacteriophage sp.]